MLKEPYPTLSAMPQCALLFGETVGGLGGFGRVPLLFFSWFFFKNEGIFASCEKTTWEGKKGGKFVSDGHKFSCSTEERSSARAGGKGRDGD